MKNLREKIMREEIRSNYIKVPEEPWVVFPKELVTGYENWKSTIEFGGIEMKTPRTFNWLQKKLLKICFNISIKDYNKK